MNYEWNFFFFDVLSDNDVEKCGKIIKKMIVCIMDLKKKYDVKYIMGNSVVENRVC